MTMLCQQTFVTSRRAKPVPLDTTGLPIGTALKVERVAAGIPLTRVANAVGVSIGQLSRIEKGERKATPELIERIRVAVRAAQENAA